MCKSILKGQNVPGTDGTYHGTDGTRPRDRRDAHQGVSRQNSLCLLVFFFPHCQGKKEYTPPPWGPSFLGLSPDPEVTEQKTLWCIPCFLGKTREKGIHHRSRKKGIHHSASDPEKEKRRVSTVVVYTLFFPVCVVV